MDVKRVVLQNPWWESAEKIRDDEKVKEATARSRKIEYFFPEENLLILGPRQVGKTTFLKLFAKRLIDSGVNPRGVVYFSCETTKHYDEIVEVVEFMDSMIEGKNFLFDEITFVEDWQRAVKFLLDSPLGRDKIFYITGSSSINIKKETFPGRPIKTREFLPLSFGEFCRVFGSQNLKNTIKAEVKILSPQEVFQKAREYIFHFSEVDNLFQAYIKCGGFPRSMYELMESEG